jgi:hypothetical protein
MRTASLLALALLASCDGGDKSEDTSTPKEVNHCPVADAGDAISQTADSAVLLTGIASSDADGDALVYHWDWDHLPESSTLDEAESGFSANHTAEAVNTSFLPDALGTYVVMLWVTDAKGCDSDPDYVIVTVEDPENLPIADAGADQETTVGSSVSLDGTGSYDPLGRSLTYSWVVVDAPEASTVSSLTGSDTATPSVTVDVKGAYTFGLVVDNGLAVSTADSVTVTVTGDDNAPVANAGNDVDDAEDCTTIQLDCSGSRDPDGDTLQYMWEIQSKPADSASTNSTAFSDRTAEMPTFYPDVAGTYVLSCAVTDGTTWSTPDTMTIVATERRSNTRPTITAGADETVEAGSAVCEESGYTYDCDECATQTVTLGSTASITDADGDPMTVLWTTDNSDATIADPTSLVTTVTLEDAAPEEPDDCAETEFEFELTVTDCTGASVTDTITLAVNCCGVEDTSAR